jgi:hypothetical protein
LNPVPAGIPSTVVSRHSGGTAHILDVFRKKASFDVNEMKLFLDGGKKKSMKRNWIVGASEGTCAAARHFSGSREDALQHHLRHFIEVHKDPKGGDYLETYVPSREEVGHMQEHAMSSGTLMNHFGLFLPTILAQADDDQKLQWLPAAMSLGVVGCYAQTELGHGSNVRGLRTVAVWDPETGGFEVDSPSLAAAKYVTCCFFYLGREMILNVISISKKKMSDLIFEIAPYNFPEQSHSNTRTNLFSLFFFRFWPGTLGKVATHAVVYAQLIIRGVEYGPHAFVMQVRDNKHRPLQGKNAQGNFFFVLFFLC